LPCSFLRLHNCNNQITLPSHLPTCTFDCYKRSQIILYPSRPLQDHISHRSHNVCKVNLRGRWQSYPQLPPHSRSSHQVHSSEGCRDTQPSLKTLLSLLPRRRTGLWCARPGRGYVSLAEGSRGQIRRKARSIDQETRQEWSARPQQDLARSKSLD
jgi:hypothetical protein